MAAKPGPLAAGGSVPNANGLVGARCCDGLPVGRETGREDECAMSLELPNLLSRRRVTKPRDAFKVWTSDPHGCQDPAVRREIQSLQEMAAGRPLLKPATRADVPEP